MPTAANSETKFQIGHVLFMDIVGYSKLLINEQTRLVRDLNEIVQQTEQFRAAEKRHRLVRVATGDGMALVFRDSPESPVRCALEISRVLRNKTPPLPIRMGIHSGVVNGVVDVNRRANVAGAGINFAQRVMDCGDDGHILLSKHVAEDLEHHAEWRSFLHDLGSCQVKHGVRMSLVNLYNSEAGNPELPLKIRQIRKKERISSALLFGTTAAVGLVVAGTTWLFLRHVTKPPAEISKPTQAVASAAIPTTIPTPVPNLILANTKVASSVWPEPPRFSPALPRAPRPAKMFAGTWRGTVHSVGPQNTWESQLDLNVDESETHWSNMTGGSVSRQGRALIYKRSYKLGNSTSVQVQATLKLIDGDDRTATYTTSQVSVTGKSRSKTYGQGTLRKID